MHIINRRKIKEQFHKVSLIVKFVKEDDTFLKHTGVIGNLYSVYINKEHTLAKLLVYAITKNGISYPEECDTFSIISGSKRDELIKWGFTYSLVCVYDKDDIGDLEIAIPMQFKYITSKYLKFGGEGIVQIDCTMVFDMKRNIRSEKNAVETKPDNQLVLENTIYMPPILSLPVIVEKQKDASYFKWLIYDHNYKKYLIAAEYKIDWADFIKQIIAASHPSRFEDK